MPGPPTTPRPASAAAPARRRPLRILFVCLGNICRSPTAEALFRHRIAGLGLEGEFEASSAGVIARHGDVSTLEAIRVAAEHGVDMRSHLSTPLTRELILGHHLVVAMDRMNVEHILNLVPDLGPRLKLLLGYDRSGRHELEVRDPMGRPIEVYRESYSQIEAGIEGLIAELTAARAGGGRDS